MSQPVDIEIVKGTCSEHGVGRTWVFEGQTPAGMCAGAFHAIMPYLFALHHGAKIDWADPDGSVLIKCPDPKGIVLRLVPKPQA